MSDLPEPKNDQSSDESTNTMTLIVDTVGAYLGNVPAAIKKNLGRAVDRLMKIPNSYIDSKAAEILAESDARILLTKTAGKKLAASMKVDDSLAEIAMQTHASKILRQQVNAAKILQSTVDEVQKLPNSSEDDVADISEDWLNAFEREAIEMSSEHMQRLFGKILAREIRRPKSYSIRTIKLIAQLDNQPAELFRRLCSLACTLRINGKILDARVISLGKQAADNGLQDYGLNFAALNILFEYGLIISDYNSYMIYAPAISSSGPAPLPFEHQGRRYTLSPKNPVPAPQLLSFKVNGVALSQAGVELLDIVDV